MLKRIQHALEPEEPMLNGRQHTLENVQRARAGGWQKPKPVPFRCRQASRFAPAANRWFSGLP